MWDAVLFFLVLSLSSPFPLRFSFPFLYSSCSFSFSFLPFLFPFLFPFPPIPFLFLFLSFSFSFSSPFCYAFLSLPLFFFPFPFPRSCEILWWRCEASAWKHDKRKKNDNVWKKKHLKGLGVFTRPHLSNYIYLYIYMKTTIQFHVTETKNTISWWFVGWNLHISWFCAGRIICSSVGPSPLWVLNSSNWFAPPKTNGWFPPIDWNDLYI